MQQLHYLHHHFLKSLYQVSQDLSLKILRYLLRPHPLRQDSRFSVVHNLYQSKFHVWLNYTKYNFQLLCTYHHNFYYLVLIHPHSSKAYITAITDINALRDFVSFKRTTQAYLL